MSVFFPAVPRLRWLVTGLSPRRPGFDHAPDHVGLVVDEGILEQVSLQVLQFLVFPCQLIPPVLDTDHLHVFLSEQACED